MKKRATWYVFLIVSYLLTLSIVRASAYSSLELYIQNPGITEYSLFVDLVVKD